MVRKQGRCYLSGPITGTSDYIKRFEEWEKYITQTLGWTVINPAKVNANLPSDTSYDEYMHMSIAMLDLCDRIMLMPGWERSKGAKYEKTYAEDNGLQIWMLEKCDASLTGTDSLTMRTKRAF